MPLISVIIAFDEEPDTIQMCVESLMRQTFLEFECLCFNATSYDKTQQILSHLSHQDNRFRILLADNRSSNKWDIYNTALKYALGDYILFMEGSDVLHPQALSILFDSLRYTHSDMVSSPIEFFNSGQKIQNLEKEIPFDKSVLKKQENNLLNAYWQNNASLISNKLDGKLLRFTSISYLRFNPDLKDESASFYLEQTLCLISSTVYMKYPVYFKKKEAQDKAICLSFLENNINRHLLETAYFIKSGRVTGYDAFCLQYKNSQDFYALLKQFLCQTSIAKIQENKEILLYFIEKMKENGLLQGLSLSLFQKLILRKIEQDRWPLAKRLMLLFS